MIRLNVQYSTLPCPVLSSALHLAVHLDTHQYYASIHSIAPWTVQYTVQYFRIDFSRFGCLNLSCITLLSCALDRFLFGYSFSFDLFFALLYAQHNSSFVNSCVGDQSLVNFQIRCRCAFVSERGDVINPS